MTQWDDNDVWAYFRRSLPGYRLLVRYYEGWIVVDRDTGSRTATRMRPILMPGTRVFYGEYRLMARVYKRARRQGLAGGLADRDR